MRHWPCAQRKRGSAAQRSWEEKLREGIDQPVGHSITLLACVFVLISACCVDKWDIVHQNVQTTEKRLHFHLANGHLVHMLRAVQCSMRRVMVQLSNKPNKIKTRMTSKTLLRSQSRVWRDLPDMKCRAKSFKFSEIAAIVSQEGGAHTINLNPCKKCYNERRAKQGEAEVLYTQTQRHL